MAKEIKPTVSKEETFDQLDIRVGKVLEVDEAPGALKKSYRLKVDFGKFGIKTSVARLTQHPMEDLKGNQVLAVLNFEARQVGDTLSEVLVLGIQVPKTDSGEATFITPVMQTKNGSKLC